MFLKYYIIFLKTLKLKAQILITLSNIFENTGSADIRLL